MSIEELMEVYVERGKKERLRDEFAMAALTGLLAGVGLDTIVSIGGLAHSFALGAHEIADAMMAERRKGGEA